MGCNKVILGNGNSKGYCKFPLSFSTICLSGSETKWSLRHIIFQWMKLSLFFQAVMAGTLKVTFKQKCSCLCFFFFFMWSFLFPRPRCWVFRYLFLTFSPKVCFIITPLFFVPRFLKEIRPVQSYCVCMCLYQTHCNKFWTCLVSTPLSRRVETTQLGSFCKT